MAAEEYRRIVLTFWTDPEVKRPLTRDQKLLLLYFCTSPHSNMIGIYYCPLAYAALETDVPLEDVRKAVAGPLSSFLSYDEQTEEVFVHGLAKHNIGSELTAIGKNGKPDNRIAGVEKLLEAVHSPRLVRAFLQRYAERYRLTKPLPESRQAPSEPLTSPSEAIAVAVAVTKQEHSSNNGPPSRRHDAKGRVRVLEPDEEAVVEHYRAVHPKRLRGEVPEKVRRLLRAALRSYPAADLCRAIDGNAASQFHRDGGHLGLDLILRDASKIDYFLDLAAKAEAQTVEMTDEMGEMRLHTKRDGWWGYERNGEWVRTAEVGKVLA